MASSAAAWSQVESKLKDEQMSDVRRLRSLLSQLDNPHAILLSGRIPSELCDQVSAEQLERLLVLRCATSSTPRKQVAFWLRIVFDVTTLLQKEKVQVYPTRLMAPITPAPSPFSPENIKRKALVERWRVCLHQWIENVANDCQSQDEWLGAIVLSASIHGALLDGVRLGMLVNQLSQGIAPLISDDVGSFEFRVPFAGLGYHHRLRFFVDPLTEMLIWRFLRVRKQNTAETVDPLLHRVIQKFFQTNHLPLGLRPRSTTAFTSACAIFWAEKSPAVELNISSRHVTAHSLAPAAWRRLLSQPSPKTTAESLSTRPVDVREQSEKEDYETSELSQLDIERMHPWLHKMLQYLDTSDHAGVAAKVKSHLQDQSSDPVYADRYIAWLDWLLTGGSSTGCALSLRTVRSRFRCVAPLLLGAFGDADPTTLSTMSLEDYYAEIIHNSDPQLSKKTIAEGICDFHVFLNKKFKKELMKDEAAVLGDKFASRLVDANLISFDDYARALAKLDDTPMQSEKRDACKIVLTLGFKAGMRRMEIFGLRLCDLQTLVRIMCLVRPHEYRRLKTDSSNRNIPLHALLDWKERRLLRDWIAKRSAQDPRKTAPLFAQFHPKDKSGWIRDITDTICTALRTVTGDDQLYLHHLRHSAGSWLYLIMLAPDYPELAQYFSKLALTQQALQRAPRTRLLLFENAMPTHRSYAHAVARLLGHSSPIMSFGHYIHTADFIMSCVCRRNLNNISDRTWRKASGFGESAAYDHLGRSVQDLLGAVRSQHADVFMKSQTPPGIASVEKTQAPGKPPKSASHHPEQWPSLDLVVKILDFHYIEGVGSEQIGKTIGIPGVATELVLTNHLHLLREHKRHPLARPVSGWKFPRPWSTEVEKTYARALAVRVINLLSKDRPKCLDGMGIHFRHYDRDEHDVVFRGKTSLKELKRYLRFLKALGEDGNTYHWMLRQPSEKADFQLPRWAQIPKSFWVPAHTRRIGPKVKRSAASYAQWLGLFPASQSKDSLGRTMMATLLLIGLTLPELEQLLV